MAIANLNTNDFIKGDGVSQAGRVITIVTTTPPNTSDVLIDCGSFTAPNENVLIDCGSFI